MGRGDVEIERIQIGGHGGQAQRLERTARDGRGVAPAALALRSSAVPIFRKPFPGVLNVYAEGGTASAFNRRSRAVTWMPSGLP